MPLTLLDTQLVQSTLVACGTLLVYDFLCTLDQEIAYAWTASWSLGSVLFFLNRYLPFIDTFLSLHLKLSVNSPETCQKEFTLVTWLIVSGIMLSELILVLRTYAIWERRRCIAIILSISSISTFIPAIIITHLELRSLKYVSSELPGCRLASASSVIIVCYILLALSETTVAVLTAIKAYQHCGSSFRAALFCVVLKNHAVRHSQPSWILQLYREGLLFYVYLLAISVANVLVPILAPRIFANWLATPQRVMHSILSNRVLLLILKQKKSSNMSNRIPLRGRGSSQGTSTNPRPPTFESFVDEELGTHMTIVRPSTGTVLSDNEEDIVEVKRT